MMKLTLLIALFSISIFQSSIAQENFTLNASTGDTEFFIGLEKPDESFNYLQVAQKFQLKKPGAVLQKLSLQRLILKISVGEYHGDASNNTSFLLRFYDIDSVSGGPGKDIGQQKVEVRNGASRTVSVNLKKYNIVIPGERFFVAVEWILNKYNERIHLGKSLGMERGDIKMQTIPIYQPFPGMIYTGSQVSNVWVMTMQKKWMLYTHNMPEMTDLAMSVEAQLP